MAPPNITGTFMNTLEFLQRVLPTSGLYATTVINKGMPPKQRFFDSVEELASVCNRLDRSNNNTYFAISAFKEKGKRTQDNTRATKVVALDVDCGPTKPYPSAKEGAQALAKFLQETGLPSPMVVFSGNGLHVYWVLTQELPPSQWVPLADSLKQATIQLGFQLDAGLTANSALVLRPVGTHNPKGGREVKLVRDTVDVEPLELQALLVKYAVPVIPQARGFGAGRPVQGGLLGALAVANDFPPADPILLVSSCRQIAWASENQDQVAEPLWYDMIGIAAFCKEPEQVAITWSEKHYSFSQPDTLRKLEQWRNTGVGPTTCSKFEQDRPGGCAGCPHVGKIASPIRLGSRREEAPIPQEVVKELPVVVHMPKPFKRTDKGVTVVVDEVEMDVCGFDIYPLSYGRDESLGYEVVRYRWNRQHVGWQELTMRQAYLTDGHREFATCLADQGIVLNGKKQTGLFQLMLRSYMDELRKIRTVTNLYSTMGWKDDNKQFILGDRLISKTDNGVRVDTVTLASASHKMGAELFAVKGSKEAWAAGTAVLEKADMPWHMFSLGLGFAAPLFQFSGLKGMTVSLYGPTGGGKSLIQLWQQSIWGNPERLHFTAKFTQNTLFSRLGFYNNLPMTIDEVTMMQDKEVGDFLYWVSQGRDKARLNRSAEEREAKTWSTVVTVSTNRSLQSKMISSGLDTDAQMARLLEITIPQHRLFTKDSSAGRAIYKHLEAHHGVVGQEFVTRILDMGQAEITRIIDEATETFAARYNAEFRGEERFWEKAIVLSDLGNRLAHEWGLIKYDYTKGTVWVLEQLGAIRKANSDNAVDAFDLIAEYINDEADAAVTVMHTGGGKPQVDYARVPRADIRVRFDVYRRAVSDPFDSGTVLLDRTHFRKWLSARGGDYKTFVNELKSEGALATPKSNKSFLGKNTPIKLGQTYVVGANLNHPRLIGILDDAETAAEDLTLGKMRALP